jgi:hypothetical protein
VREEAHRQVRVEVGRLAIGDTQHPAPLGRLGEGVVRGEERQQADQKERGVDDGRGATAHGFLLAR